MIEKQEKAENRGKYKVALTCKNKIGHLKDHLLAQKLNELKEEHRKDRKRIKQAHEN